MNRQRPFSAAWISVALLSAGSARAQPPPSEVQGSAAQQDAQAVQDVKTARRLASERDFGSAYLRLSRAYAASHDPELLVEMAGCEKAMQHSANAVELVDRALSEAAERPGAMSDTQMAAARDLRNALLPSVGRVRVSVDAPGAISQMDDRTVGRSPLAADVWVDTGSHTVRVSKTGYRDVSTNMTVYGTSERLLDVKLEPDVPVGRLRIETSPKNTVIVDGIVGYGNWDGRVPAATFHTVEVSAPGMNTFESSVKVPADMTRTFHVKLDPDRTAPPWLWVVAGAVVVGAAIVAGVVVFRPDPTTAAPVATASSGLQVKWP